MTYKYDDFHACLEQAFSLDTGEGDQLELTLVSVERHPHGDTFENKEVFSILFRGPVDRQIMQNTYTLENETMGELALFIVPVGPDQKGMCYEAVFS
mgnify:CR=1 FL=1